ncbi:hypothetical protein CASFOL_038628 [Castilleja foliolosa]|uniref:Uncharacterized protein n=1 Tax=Castilleja foliolosa TaxID=1961234 RepID=A0ABD3BLZ4_9LAMI
MEAESFLEKIKPPRLEDAGLEDCALPSESIKEAFLKAASAVKSIIPTSGGGDENEGPCVEDPWEDSSDVLVGITEGLTGPSEGCVVEKGSGLTVIPGDKVVVGGENTEVDALVGPGVEARDGEAACVDGLQGLEIRGKSRGILGKQKFGGSGDEVVEDGEKESVEKLILA